MLLGNCTVLNKSPMRKFAGTTQSAERSNFGTSGAMRNRQLVDRNTTANTLYAVPQGAYAGLAWLLPQKAGSLSGYSPVAVSTAALAVGGITTTGTSSITFTVADATGSLIASGSGAASIVFTVADALLVASINGAGSSAFSVTSNTPLLGAVASGSGSSTMTFSVANAQAYPLVDTSPLRTGTANFAFTGSLTPYAIGQMSGSTVDSSALTVDTIAAGILAAAWNSPIAANIRQVNSTSVTGNGQTGSEWGPA